MTIIEMENMAKNQKLIIRKYKIGEYIRRQYIYSNELDILDQQIIQIKKVPYARFYYFCRTPEMPLRKNYKITAKDFELLKKAGAIEE